MVAQDLNEGRQFCPQCVLKNAARSTSAGGQHCRGCWAYIVSDEALVGALALTQQTGARHPQTVERKDSLRDGRATEPMKCAKETRKAVDVV